MTKTTATINSSLTIKSVKGLKFTSANGKGYYSMSGLAFYVGGKGWVSFDGETPYIPAGGRKALKSIIASGGFADFDGMSFIKGSK